MSMKSLPVFLALALCAPASAGDLYWPSARRGADCGEGRIPSELSGTPRPIATVENELIGWELNRGFRLFAREVHRLTIKVEGASCTGNPEAVVYATDDADAKAIAARIVAAYEVVYQPYCSVVLGVNGVPLAELVPRDAPYEHRPREP